MVSPTRPLECDATHDPQQQSWVDSSRDPDGEFPLQNLPWCVVQDPRGDGYSIGVGIGDEILNVRRVAGAGCFAELREHPLSGPEVAALQAPNLQIVMGMSASSRHRLRRAFFELLEEGCPVLRDRKELHPDVFFSRDDAEFQMPARIGDYTDFYASIYHATNVGSMLRPENPLLPNYRWIPVGYHGRSSSVVLSGTSICRPSGQVAPLQDGGAPQFKPCANLDYELELGFWIAGGNPLGIPIPIVEAEAHFFGVSLLNDWSARDLQKWEYQPLGPFLAKNFATSISPWIVTREALAPFRCPAATRAETDPQPLAHLTDDTNQLLGGIALTLEVWLTTAAMREQGVTPSLVSQGSFRDMYWTVAQMITHHSSNGCNLQPGDLMGSGTVSGPARETRGCLLERTWAGEFGAPVPSTQRVPLKLPTGEERVFLQDGDEVILRGYAIRDGARRIGLGECRGQIVSGSNR